MRIRSGVRVLWRADGVTQFGTDARRAFALRGLSAAEQALCERLVRQVPGDADLLRVARMYGADPERARELVVALRRGGVLVDSGEEPDGGDGGYWERAAGIARAEDGKDGGEDVLERRGRACVAVLGSDRVGVGVAAALAAAGVGSVLLDDDRPVAAADVGPGGFLASDVGSSRRSAAIGALRRARPDVRVSARGQVVPDVVVLSCDGVADPWLSSTLVREDVPHLAVVVRELDVVVGPFVVPGASACLRCVELHRTERDPRWPALATQLAADEPVGPESVTAQLAAALAARDVLAHLDARVPATQGATLEVDPFTPLGRVRTWETHPRCGCSGGAFSAVVRPGSGRGGRRHLGLARTAAATLARDDDAVHEHLAAPDTPRLAPADGAGEALDAERAVAAERLGALDVVTALGEPEVADVGVLAGQRGGADEVRRRGDGRDRRPGR